MTCCPVCRSENRPAPEGRCPVCGTDLLPLFRVRELPFAILNEGLARAKAGDLASASALFQAAALFPPARRDALLLLGKCQAAGGRLAAAIRSWTEAAAGDPPAEGAAACLAKAVALREQASFRRRARTLACGNPECARRGRRGSIVFVGVRGRRRLPLWRCASCGREVPAGPAPITVRSRPAPARVRAVPGEAPAVRVPRTKGKTGRERP